MNYANASSSVPVSQNNATSSGKLKNPNPQSVKISSIAPGKSKPTVVRKDTSEEAPVAKQAVRYSYAQKVQAITLITHKYNPHYVEFCTGIPPRAQLRIMESARKRGYDFLKNPRIEDLHVVEGRMTGRPKGRKDNKPRKRGPRKKRKNTIDVNIEAIGNDDPDQADTSDSDNDDDGQQSASEDGNAASALEPHDAQTQSSDFQMIAAQLAGIQNYLPRGLL